MLIKKRVLYNKVRRRENWSGSPIVWPIVSRRSLKTWSRDQSKCTQFVNIADEVDFFASESPDTLFEMLDVDEEFEISIENSAEEVNMKYKHDM